MSLRMQMKLTFRMQSKVTEARLGCHGSEQRAGFEFAAGRQEQSSQLRLDFYQLSQKDGNALQGCYKRNKR